MLMAVWAVQAGLALYKMCGFEEVGKEGVLEESAVAGSLLGESYTSIIGDALHCKAYSAFKALLQCVNCDAQIRILSLECFESLLDVQFFAVFNSHV